MSTAMLEVRGLRRVFGNFTAVDSVDMSIPPGQVRALIGPNGAGKSTLFNLIAGSLRPTSGEVLMEGKPLRGTACTRAKAGIARTFQGSNAFARLTCQESVETAIISRQKRTARVFGRWRSEIGDEAEEVLAAVGLERFASLEAQSLSHGDQRLLEVATALALKPKMLLFDEPTAGMSPTETHSTMDLIGSMVRQQGLTVLLCEHDMEVVFSVADRVTVLDGGVVIAEGKPEEIRANEDVIKRYLGEEL